MLGVAVGQPGSFSPGWFCFLRVMYTPADYCHEADDGYQTEKYDLDR